MIDWINIHVPTWLFITFIVHLTVLGSVAYMILLERKVASWVQDRIGPNRVGLGFGIIPFLKDMKMFGLGQPLVDGLKFILKEDYRPKNVDRILFTLAPVVMIVTIIVSIAVVPWGGIKQTTQTIGVSVERSRLLSDAEATTLATAKSGLLGSDIIETTVDRSGLADKASEANVIVTSRYRFQIANLNIGVLFVLATLSLAVYGVVIGGWASNNKYSFLGGLRATANMISYEIPLSLAVLSVVVIFGTLDLGIIVEKQSHLLFGFLPAWNIFTQPLAFFIFLVCIHAEANRAPFDLAEAEQELVGGYHTEYSSMRFALFFLAEYAGMITTSAVCVALFFGGWHLPLPGINGTIDPSNHAITDSLVVCVMRALIFFGKTLGIIFVFMWVRWSLPRFRFDQLMQLAWRGLIPVSLAMVMVTAVTVYLAGGASFESMDDKTAVMLLGANVLLVVGTLIGSRLIPKAPFTNRRIIVPGSRFSKPAVAAAK